MKRRVVPPAHPRVRLVQTRDRAGIVEIRPSVSRGKRWRRLLRGWR